MRSILSHQMRGGRGRPSGAGQPNAGCGCRAQWRVLRSDLREWERTCSLGGLSSTTLRNNSKTFNWWKRLTAACTLQSVYKWRVDLSKSEKYWDGWFRGTSNLFLACNLPKLLLLAGGFFTNIPSQLLTLKATSQFCALLHLCEKESTG